MIVNLNLENKNILIVGGGKKAYQIGSQFENVHYLSPNFIEEIKEEQRIYKHYESSDIDDYFFVVAASIKSELNHQVVSDCKEKNKCCASIQNDNDSSIQFLHEKKYKFLNLGYQTKNTTNKYYEILDKEFEDLYQRHEPVLENLQYIFEYTTTHFDKYQTRQSIIDEIVENNSQDIDVVCKLMKEDIKRIFCFDAPKTKENIETIDCFFHTCENNYPYMFKNKDIEHMCELLELNIEFKDVSLDLFSIDELRNLMKTTPYSFYIYNRDVSQFRKKLTRSYKTFQVNENIPDINKPACVFTLLNEGIDTSIFQNLKIDDKYLMQQEFFMPVLKEKLEIK
ncbi:MAG: NAD(P)-dependent oxidoreductase [Erysipelotrichaceae bacterium]|uniref:NAD(P)-dependent oxidoreductase n=1 Tax=Floccifex sp. TaxID=2815810 RepID=UPI002A75A74F|nr:NAD(P)-dependent oxidoreductase [Floccifex sp.]MDD7280523.1 NAD(P)-dependent oxidoreductase [Erysipelotrichaceae bacterium]MDY2957930.1 NAD(P)-dependent oxidoreductase [Floccifex sp.]